MNSINLAISIADEMIENPKQLLTALGPTSDDKEHMKYIAKVIFAIVQTLNGLHVPLKRQHFSSFVEKCVPSVLVEVLNKETLTTVLHKVILDFFIPLQPILLNVSNSDVVEVKEDLFNCFSYESVEYGYRCNGTGKMVFTIEEALQWFLTRGLKSPDGTEVLYLEKVKKKGSTIIFPSLPLNLLTVIQQEYKSFLMTDLFFSKPSYKIENALDFRYEFMQDWNEAEDDPLTQFNMIIEIASFATAWEINIPSLWMMKSLFQSSEYVKQFIENCKPQDEFIISEMKTFFSKEKTVDQE
jgi:hypothetical protein